jgi:ATP-dependent helicase/nuclease subunit A
VFAAGSRAEIAIAGSVAGRKISGQIDRLAVGTAEVLIVDFKTNRPPPAAPEEISSSYLAQMASYAALLEKIHPGKKIRAALLWTNIPRLMELDSVLLQRGREILLR